MALCVDSGSDGLWERKEAPSASGRVWVKPTSLSTGLHLLHEKGNHEVSLRRKGRRAGPFLYALQFDCTRCLMGESCAQLVDDAEMGRLLRRPIWPYCHTCGNSSCQNPSIVSWGKMKNSTLVSYTPYSFILISSTHSFLYSVSFIEHSKICKWPLASSHSARA